MNTYLLLTLPHCLPPQHEAAALAYARQMHQAAQLAGQEWSIEAVLGAWEAILHVMPEDDPDHAVLSLMLERAGEPGEASPAEVAGVLAGLDLYLQVEGMVPAVS